MKLNDIFFCSRNDYIAIYDELGNQVGCRRCGAYTKPIEFQVRGRVAVIEFNSDSTVHKTGFKLTYKGAKAVGKSDPWCRASVKHHGAKAVGKSDSNLKYFVKVMQYIPIGHLNQNITPHLSPIQF